MPAATFNFIDDFRIEQGAYREQSFIWKDNLGVPIDMTGYTARMQLRKSVTSSTVILSLTTENGGILIDALNGKITLVFKEIDTSGKKITDGVYDLELINVAGNTSRFLEGSFEISPEVTR